MAGLLLVAVVMLGAVFISLERVGNSLACIDSLGGLHGDSRGDADAINPATELSKLSDEPYGFDAACNACGLDDEAWSLSHRDAMAGPFDDFSRGVPDASDDCTSHHTCINPATGLPMMSDSEAGIDVGGNPYGFRNDDLFTHHDGFEAGIGMGPHGFGEPPNAFDTNDWS